MALVDSLLTAMVRANGDALVMHVGEKPIVVARSRSIDLSNHGLNLNAMVGMLAHLLPADAQASLAEFGAVEHRLPPRGSDHFTVVAARGGDDIWIEIRRRRDEPSRDTQAPASPAPGPEPAPQEPVAHEPAPPEPAVAEPSAEEQAPAVAHAEPPAAVATAAAQVPAAEDMLAADEEPVVEAMPLVEAMPAGEAMPAEEGAQVEPLVEALVAKEAEAVAEAEAEAVAEVSTPAPELSPVLAEFEPGLRTSEPVEESEPAPATEAPATVLQPAPSEEQAMGEPQAEAPGTREEEPAVAQVTVSSETEEPVAETASPSENAMTEASPEVAPEVGQEETAVIPDAEIPRPMTEGLTSSPLTPEAAMFDAQSVGAVTAVGGARTQATTAADMPGGMGLPPTAPGESSAAAFAPVSGDALPVTRTVRIEVPARSSAQRTPSAERLLRLAVERGATELFLMTQARPYLRVGGEVRLLQDEPALSAAELDAVLSDITPEPSRDAVSRGERVEWLVELADVGRVRCASFRDHRGPGAVFHLLSTRAATVEQLGLEADARSLASEPDGLVIVAGPAGSDKSAILAAFVDEINRHRADYMITIEPCVYLVHENVQALVSQREVGTDPARAVATTRAALNENPDVLVIDDLASGDVAALAVQAASQGRLVLVSLEAGSTAEAVQRLVELVPTEKRSATRDALARTFRGAIAQQLLRKTAGGRVAARELLMGTGAVARVLADHAHADVAAAIEAARGGTPLADAVAGYVKSGVVDVREAFRKAPNRERLVAALRAAGVSTASIDRLQ